MRALLFLTGLLGSLFWLVIIVAGVFTMMLGSAYGNPSTSGPPHLETVAFVAPAVTFAVYAWIAFRSWSPLKLLLWGIVLHIPHVTFWLPHATEDEGAFFLVAVLMAGMGVYVLHAWMTLRQHEGRLATPDERSPAA